MSAWKQVLKTWQNNILLQFISLGVLSLCLTAVMGVLLISKNTKLIFDKWADNLEITVYLAENISEDEQTKLLDFLKNKEIIKESKYVSKQEAKAKFQESLSDYAPELKTLEDADNPFPNTIEAKLNFSSGIEQISKNLSVLSNQISAFTGVEEVSWGKQWLEKYSSFFTSVKSLSFALALIVICSALFVIVNSIRSSIYQKRNEIEILELVGATKAMIRRPFILEAIVLSSLTAIVSFVLLFTSYKILDSLYSKTLKSIGLYDGIVFFSFSEGLFLLLGFVVLSGITAYICVKNINTGWSASEA